MSILYHLTMPKPHNPALDAVVQEAQTLQQHFGGEFAYVNPSKRPGSRYPERFYGLHRLPFLRGREPTVKLHHVFNPHPLAFPYLRWLRRPIVYTVTAGLRPSHPPSLPGMRRFAAIVATNQRDQQTLEGLGLDNVKVIQPAIDTSRFVVTPPPVRADFTLLAASAPWTEEQFASKGVDALLGAADRRSDLRLIFLWRGLLYDQMLRRVAARGLQERVQVVNQEVEVAAVMARVHAAVVLATDASLVKAFPHSLMEALAGGRPVLLSQTLPMADYVARSGCGYVIESVTPEGVLAALNALEARYDEAQAVAATAGQQDFSQARLVAAYKAIYKDASALHA